MNLYCGDIMNKNTKTSISCFNVKCIILGLSHFVLAILHEQSPISFDARYCETCLVTSCNLTRPVLFLILHLNLRGKISQKVRQTPWINLILYCSSIFKKWVRLQFSKTLRLSSIFYLVWLHTENQLPQLGSKFS